MSSSKNIYKLRDFATGVYKSIKTGDTPLSCVNKYMYVYSVSRGGGERYQVDRHLPQSPFTGHFFR